MTISRSCPSESRKAAFIASLYLVPSLNMWPTSIPRVAVRLSRAARTGVAGPGDLQVIIALDREIAHVGADYVHVLLVSADDEILHGEQVDVRVEGDVETYGPGEAQGGRPWPAR